MILRQTLVLLASTIIVWRPRHQELYKKEFVFVNPASIGPNLIH